MTSADHHSTFLHHPAVDETGEVIGQITDVLFDESTDDPTWAVINPGPLRRSRYVPLANAYHSDDGAVVLSHRKRVVMSAPAATGGHVLGREEERELHEYYSS